MLATVVDTLRDLGAPAVIGAVVGALIAHLTAKARGREDHQRALELQAAQQRHAHDLQLSQDERRAAQAVLEAARRLRTRVNDGDTAFGDLHNDWQDLVFAPSKLVRSEDLNERVRTFGAVIFLATMQAKGLAPFWISYGRPPSPHRPQ